MLSLILLIVFGLGMAYFATQNTGTVHILLGSYMLTGIPLYIIVTGSLLLGVFISWLINITNSISSRFTIHSKESALKEANQTIKELREENHKLDLEIARVKGQESIAKNTVMQENDQAEEEKVVPSPSLFHRVRHSFS